MTDKDFDRISKLVKDQVRDIKDIVEIIKHRVDTLQMFQSTASDNIRLMKEQQSLMNEKLDNQSAALVSIESRLDGFADSWKINRAEINKVKKHLGLPAISE